MKIVRRGWWWWLDYLYAGLWQLRSLIPGAPPRSLGYGKLRPVLIIPGIYETWRFMQPIVVALNAAGHPVHVLPLLRHNRRPVAASAELIAEYLEQHELEGVVIVAHSKGGLIGKFLMLEPRTAARIHSMVTICTPFSGSRYARLMVLPSLRAFSPRNSVTRRMASELAVNERITSIFGVFDPHIPEGSELPGARNIRLDIGGHFRILGKPTTIAAVLEGLPANGGPTPQTLAPTP